ncbi:MAG: 23S rRNA (adenine(2503)-C(2))-methyltransferase RlmN [Elusimicrobiota bacterium]
MTKQNIQLLDKNLEEMQKFMHELNQPSFRARQIFKWIYEKKVSSTGEMLNIPRDLKKLINEKADFSPLTTLSRQVSKDGTEKFLFRLKDAQHIESVYIPYRDGRRSICLSTQAGCAMGCAFCASAEGGLKRNLSCGEIVNQILTVEKIKKEKITNVVFMGIGEPLANYSRVLKAISIINSDPGMNISMRKITLSTCGLVPQIYRLADEKLQLTLAVSLNSSRDETRSSLMPINKKFPLDKLLKSCRYYADKTGRRISFEYVLIKNLNDSYSEAKNLAGMLEDMLCHVNLIPANPVSDGSYLKAHRNTLKMFKSELTKKNIAVSIRKEKGKDISAACGQLRNR